MRPPDRKHDGDSALSPGSNSRPRAAAPLGLRLGLRLAAGAAVLVAGAASANNPPIITKQVLYTEVDRPASIWLAYSDPDGPKPFTVDIVNPPVHGDFAHIADDDPQQPRHYELTPTAGYHGFDQFQYTVTDGQGNVSALATVRMLVNQVPLGHDQNVLTLMDQPLTVTLDYADDGLPRPAVITIQQNPFHGTLTEIAPGVYRYVPVAGYHGMDRFQWSVSDGKASSPWAKTLITVNQPPHLADSAVTTARDTPVEIRPALDDDGLPGPLSFEVVDGPDHGTLVETQVGVYLYTPEAGFGGRDSFLLKANDGMVDSNTATVTIDVNAPPQAFDQDELALFDEPLIITLDYTDDGYPADPTFFITWGPGQGGKLTPLSPGVLRYDPPQVYSRTDSFTWKVYDGALYSEQATVHITINQRPTARDQSVGTLPGVALQVVPDATDDGIPGPLTFDLSADPANGSVVQSQPGVFTYTPNPGFSGSDTFTWTANDGQADSNSATVTVSVNGPPQAFEQNEIALYDEPLLITLHYADDGYPADPTFVITWGPGQGGKLTPITPGVLLYTAPQSETRTDSFTWRVYDGDKYSDQATVHITINRRPVVKNQNVLTPAGVPVTLVLSAQDDGIPGPLAFTIESAPGGTLVESQPGTFTYTPDEDFSGTDSFTWTASDGMAESSPATMTVLVNGKPEAFPQSFDALPDTPVTLELDWRDDGYPQAPTFIINSGLGNPHLTELGLGVYLYTPEPGFEGFESFNWRIFDGAEYSERVQVQIEVHVAQKMEITPRVVNFVEAMGTDVAHTTVEVANAGGGDLDWTVTPSDPRVSVSPSAGVVRPNQPMTLEVAMDMADLPVGEYTAALTFTGSGGDPVVVPVSLKVSDLPGKDIGLEDMIELELSKDKVGGQAGEISFVNGPGEPPTLEVSLLPDAGVAWLFLTAAQDLSSTEYIELDLDAPVGSWYQPVLLENAPEGDVWWGVDPDYVYVPGKKRVHLPIENFHPWNIAPDRPIDLANVTQVQLKLSIPVAGEYGYPGDDDQRRLRLIDLRVTESSIDILKAEAEGGVTVTLDATAELGTMVRPWEGIIAFQDEDVFLTDLGFNQTRESTMDVNDWTINDELMRGVGDYDFTKIDDTYRRFDPNVEHLPWIPTIPFFLWQVQDPDILGDDGQVPRPKYAFMPPSDYDAWQTVVADFVRYHYDQGYNIKGFSILNEPDNRAFWQGTAAEGFEFYAKTAAAIKGVDPAIKVAGPSTAGTASPLEIQNFLTYCADADAPIDYLSFHGYTAGASGSRLYEAAQMVKDQLAQYGGRFADTKLVLNEWGYGLSRNFEERSQEPIAAAAVASSFKGIVDGGYDTALWFSLNAMDTPEYYASGLFDFDGVSARPTLYAFDLFNRLGSTRVMATLDKPETGVEAFAAIDPETGVVRLITWWHLTGNGREAAAKEVTIDFNLPLAATYDWERVVIDDQHGNLVPGVGYIPLEPVETGIVDGPAGQLQLELPLYGVSMVTLTPR